jgi:hypothetical protein
LTIREATWHGRPRMSDGRAFAWFLGGVLGLLVAIGSTVQLVSAVDRFVSGYTAIEPGPERLLVVVHYAGGNAVDFGAMVGAAAFAFGGARLAWTAGRRLRARDSGALLPPL